jgi:diguanylate cyclase (GGDEF)-like protein/PAS domain S-box-containing protein
MGRLLSRTDLRVVEKETTRVLLVEDNPGDVCLLREMIDKPGVRMIELSHVGRISDMNKHLATDSVEVVMLDLGLPDAQGLEAVRDAHSIAPQIPLIVLTGLDDEILAAQALKEGAQAYLVKGQITGRGVHRAIRYAIERKSIEETLFAEQERARIILDSVGDAVISVDISGNVVFLNPAAENLTGWSRQDATGKPLKEVFRIDEVTGCPAAIQRRQDSHVEARTANGILIDRNEFKTPIEYSAAPCRDRSARFVGVAIAFHDVSKARAMEQKLFHLAQHDSLTELPNRILLRDRLTQAIALATRRSNKLAVLFVDLDRFKHINDSLGHEIGDKLLQSIAKRLTDCVRSSDTVGRLGGDEFVVVLPEIADAGDAGLVSTKVLSALTAVHRVGQQSLYISASIGISVFPDDGLDGDTLIKNADIAMYRVKQTGRNAHKFFKAGINARAVERQPSHSRPETAQMPP